MVLYHQSWELLMFSGTMILKNTRDYLPMS